VAGKAAFSDSTVLRAVIEIMKTIHASQANTFPPEVEVKVK